MDFIAMADIRRYKIFSLTTSTDGDLFVFMLTSDVEHLSNIRATIQIVKTSQRYSIISTVDSTSVNSAVPALTQTRIEKECLSIIKELLKAGIKKEVKDKVKRETFHPQM